MKKYLSNPLPPSERYFFTQLSIKPSIRGYILAIRGVGVAQVAELAETPQEADLRLTDIPTWGCIYCGRNTGCYTCGGHGVIGDRHGESHANILIHCEACLSACTACAFMRNLVRKITRGKQ